MIEWNTDNGVNTLCEENIILSLKEFDLSIEKVHSLSFVTNFKWNPCEVISASARIGDFDVKYVAPKVT